MDDGHSRIVRVTQWTADGTTVRCFEVAGPWRERWPVRFARTGRVRYAGWSAYDAADLAGGRADAVLIRGSEPLMCAALPELLRRLRRQGARLLALETTGARPQLLADMIHAGLLDFVDLRLGWLQIDGHGNLREEYSGPASAKSVAVLADCPAACAVRFACVAGGEVFRKACPAFDRFVRSAGCVRVQMRDVTDLAEKLTRKRLEDAVEFSAVKGVADNGCVSAMADDGRFRALLRAGRLNI